MLNRQFAVSHPNQVWAADLTYCWTEEGWLYLAVILDLASRRVVGWATSRRLDRELVVRALRQALALRQPAPGLVHHSDRGTQYASLLPRLASRGVRASMSRRGDCWDKNFFATLKRELVEQALGHSGRGPARAEGLSTTGTMATGAIHLTH